jgi:hypothetical protein
MLAIFKHRHLLFKIVSHWDTIDNAYGKRGKRVNIGMDNPENSFWRNHMFGGAGELTMLIAIWYCILSNKSTITPGQPRPILIKVRKY